MESGANIQSMLQANIEVAELNTEVILTTVNHTNNEGARVDQDQVNNTGQANVEAMNHVAIMGPVNEETMAVENAADLVNVVTTWM
jgi:hypothetical protein